MTSDSPTPTTVYDAPYGATCGHIYAGIETPCGDPAMYLLEYDDHDGYQPRCGDHADLDAYDGEIHDTPADFNSALNVDAFIDRLESLADQGRLSAHTVDTYQGGINAFANWYQNQDNAEGDITASDVDAYMEHKAQQGAANQTIQTHFHAINRYLKWQDRSHVVDDIDPDNYMGTTGTPDDTPDYLDDDEIQALKDAADDPRDRAIVHLLASTGMRVGEAVSLNTDNLDLAEGEVQFVRTKRNEQVIDHIPLGGQDVTVLDKYLEVREKYGPAHISDALFLTRQGRMSSDTMQRRLKGVAEQADGVDPDDVTVHKIRHWVGTKLAKEGRTAAEIADYLGHSSTDTATKYIHLSSEHRKDLRDDLEA